jgi:hypothetical protein
MPKKMWILLDSITKIQSQQLETEQLQLAILKMSERDWLRFYVWTPGWQNWQMLRDFLNSDQKEFALSGAEVSEASVKSHIQKQIVKAAKPTAADQASQDADTVAGPVNYDTERSVTKSMTMISSTEDTLSHTLQDYDGHKLAKEPTAAPKAINFKQLNEAYSNRAERHELKIEILLINQRSQTFKSYSRNISLTGTLLEDNIPFDFYGTPFDVIVVNRNAAQSPHAKVQIKGEYIMQQAKLTKKSG